MLAFFKQRTGLTMITRRAFHTHLLAGLALAVTPRGTFALPAEATDDLWLNRLTFGATDASRQAIAARGRQGWLEDQLSLGVSDGGLEARLARARLRIAYEAGQDENGNRWPDTDELRPLSLMGKDPADLVHLMMWDPAKAIEYSERIRPAQEVTAASMIRAVNAEAQLREVMTQFWHDHFSVNSIKDETTAAFFASHDALMRTHAFGNFRTLLGEVARSPAMLYYLNNADSRASPANENYARELLELHTLGAENYLNDQYTAWRDVPGAEAGQAEGYLDLDVYETARAFTGWSVGDGRWIAEGEYAPLTGRFHYIAQWHDPYQKRILGREFPPNNGPMEDGDEVLDMLARHPGTARFVCTKIARRLLADDPDPALVARMAEVFLGATEAEDQIAQVIRALVLSPDFEAPATKLRRPFEMLAALYRATGAEVTATDNNFQGPLMRAGWQQHEYGPPTGHPDKTEAWTGASTLNRMIDLALYAHDDWFGVATADLVSVDGAETISAFLARHAGDLVPGRADELAGAVIEAFGFDPAQSASEIADEDRRGAASVAIAYAALTPDFILR
jgi:uncharacterized protein (DUF1800 family)